MTPRREVSLLRPALVSADGRHTYTMLRGLTWSTGGMVVAATTSLPNCGGPRRNYGQGYVRIRTPCPE